MRIPIATALATFTLCMLTETVCAQEYCVTCTGPDARYRCTIGGNPGLAGGGSRAQLLCITELARLGPHASCSVARTTSGPCEGELRTVMFPNAAPLPGEAEIQPGAAVPGAQLPPPAGGVPGAPQATWEVVPQAPGQVAPEATWEAVTQTPAEGAPQTPVEGAPRTAEEGTEPPVQSPGESLKKAGEAIGDGAKAAGNAVGNAVKKTWTCLSSFFGDC